ncbi:MAG: class I SAM-dependent methyltransferase [Bdellovibrionota bacterium]|nr:MAG: class I SAM-dependent methyltransferase [Bdellovibrionota bacterium]
MARIRSRVREQASELRAKEPAFQGYVASPAGKDRGAEDLIRSEELRYLNQAYGYAAESRPETIQSHRGGLIGRVIVSLKRRMMALLWNSVLRDYFERERDFQAHLVRYLNETSRHIAERDAAIFWELIRKIDVDITRVFERLERISSDQGAALHSTRREITNELLGNAREFQARLDALASNDAQREQRLGVVEDVVHGLESLVSRITRAVPAGTSTPMPAVEVSFPDASYVLLENRFRGSEEEIRRRLTIYPDIFKGAALPILEIGAGRGELQQLFREAAIPAYGVDLDPAMTKISQEKGLDVRHADALQHLRSCAPRSLGGVIAVQVIEHLTREQLGELLRLCADRVVVGGRVVFETINPKSVLALSSNYFRDPTHVFPGHPDTISFAMELAGIRVHEVRYLSPVPECAKLKEVEVDEAATPRWQLAVEQMNRNIRQLNELLFGPQDFAVIGEVRA